MNHLLVSWLSKNEDAYGNNIYDYYHGLGGGYDIIEREDGVFTLNGDSDAYTESFEFWSEIQKKAALFVKGKTLDIGCGGGKHAVHFQNFGLEIWGMDNSPLGIEVCKARGLKRTVLCDLGNLNSEIINELDTVILWGNNFGLLQNEILARRFFKAALNFCKKDAKIIIETLDPYGKAFSKPEDKIYIQQNVLNGRMGGQIRVRVRYKAYVTPWSDYLFVSKTELNEILKNTGWRVTEYIDDLHIDQYIAILERI